MSDFEALEIVREFDSAGETIRILDGVTVKLNRGENLAVLGPSGSGKSTFLHIAGTLDTATSGAIRLDGQPYPEAEERQLARFRNQNIGFVFQEHHLLPQLSALENVLIPVIANGPADRAAISRAESLLDLVGLTDRANHRPGTLSGGERQRVAVARALVREPVLLLADEPTGSLDQENAELVGRLLLDLQQQSNTILICVTHSGKLASMFGNQVQLQRGRFVSVSQ